MNCLQERYKLSQYNVFYQDGDVQYVWNTYSDALLKLDKNGQEYIRSFAGTDDKSYEFDLLKTNDFIVYEQIDEFGRICLQEKQVLFTNNPGGLTFLIVPGMACNFSCSYCFQATAEKSGIMTPETAEKVAEYICCQLECNQNIKQLRITWFGGEPLLYVNIIEIISHKIIEYTRRNEIKYSASIISNGRFLDAKTLSLLKDCYVETAQITIDGTRDLYCKSKGASSEDFDSVINNIKNAVGAIKMAIRLNIPNNDANEAIALTDYLLIQCNLLSKVPVYFAYVCDYSTSADVSQQKYINYVQNYFKWLDYMIEHFDKSDFKTKVQNIKSRPTTCNIIRLHNSCIGPHGELYKCEHCLGNKPKIIGNVWQGRFFNEAEMVYYKTVDDPTKNKCSKCEYLPICMSDCANDWVNGFSKFNCEAHKQLLLRLKLLECDVFNFRTNLII